MSYHKDLTSKSYKDRLREMQEKSLSSKLIEEVEHFIPKQLKRDIGLPEEAENQPSVIDSNIEGYKSRTVVKGEDEEDDLVELAGSKKVDRQMKELYDDLNPKKYQERAEQRLKTYLPDDLAKQLIKGMK